MNIVLGVTGGIAAYKAVSLARLLVLAGHNVHIVPTADALRFVGLPTWEAISRNPVTVSVHDNVHEVRHVRLGQEADLVIVAPATANSLAKMTAGIADDLLGTTLLAAQAPVLVAPAMHTEMWLNPATQHNMRVLRERGVQVIGPDSGQLTGTDVGPGRMSDPEAIAAAAEALLSAGDYAGTRVLVSAGGTREPIDPVRYLGNRSSGKQGVALAAAAAARGADVTLVSANIDSSVLAEAIHPRIHVIQVGTAAEMQGALEAEIGYTDVLVMAAAVADYRVVEVADGKLRKEDTSGVSPTIELTENPDILAGLVRENRLGRESVGQRAPNAPVFVGFAAETVGSQAELIERGRRKLQRKGVDLLAVNAVGWTEGFETSHNSITVLKNNRGPAADGPAADGQTSAPAPAHGTVTRELTGSKREVADGLLSEILGVLREA